MDDITSGGVGGAVWWCVCDCASEGEHVLCVSLCV